MWPIKHMVIVTVSYKVSNDEHVLGLDQRNWFSKWNQKLFLKHVVVAVNRRPLFLQKNHLTVIWMLALSSHHWEFSISKPHDPSGSLSSSAPPRHPPGYNAAWPPRESSQLPPNQFPDAKTTTVLQPKEKTNHPLWSGPRNLNRFNHRIILRGKYTITWC